MTGQTVWESLGSISEMYIEDAIPPSWKDSSARPHAADKKSFRVLEFFLDNGWVAAVLSTVVAVSLIVALVLAGRGGPDEPPVGSVGESDTVSTQETAPEAEPPYELIYTPFGDGTCSVFISVDSDAAEDFDVVIPETSPAGDTVVEIAEKQFTLLLPHIMTPEFFEENIKQPLEKYYGVTAEEAETYHNNMSHPLFVPSFELSKTLILFNDKIADNPPFWEEMVERYPQLEHGDFCIVDSTLTAYEEADISATLARAGVSPEVLFSAYAAVDEICGFAEGTTAAQFDALPAGPFNSGRHIRSVTLPDTVKVIGDMAFFGCVNLTSIDLGEVEVIGSNAFGHCNKLTELHIPSTLREIRDSYSEEYEASFQIEPSLPLSLYVEDEATLWRTEWRKLLYVREYYPDSSPTYLLFVGGERLDTLTLPENVTHLYYAIERDPALPAADGVRAVYMDPYLIFCSNGREVEFIIPAGTVYCERPPLWSATGYTFAGTIAEWEAVEKAGWSNQIQCTDGRYQPDVIS